LPVRMAFTTPYKGVVLCHILMVIVAKATDTRLDLFALRSEPRMLATGRFERVLGLLQAHGCLWGPTRPALFGLVIRAYRVGLQPFELLCGFANGLVCRPFFGGYGTGDGFDQLVLHMKQVRRVMRLQIMFHISQEPGCFIAGRLDDPAIEL